MTTKRQSCNCKNCHENGEGSHCCCGSCHEDGEGSHCCCGSCHEDGDECSGCGGEDSHKDEKSGGVVHFGYTMKVLSPTTGDSFIVAAEWTDDDEDMDHMLAEVSFLIAAASCIGPDDFGYAFMGHGNNAGTADVILRSGHPPLREIKDKILGWLRENGPHLGERYCAYTLETQ